MMTYKLLPNLLGQPHDGRLLVPCSSPEPVRSMRPAEKSHGASLPSRPPPFDPTADPSRRGQTFTSLMSTGGPRGSGGITVKPLSRETIKEKPDSYYYYYFILGGLPPP